MTDSPGGSYENDTDAAVTTAAPYDLTGKQGCYVHYDMRLRTETNFDSLRVETSPHGFSSWTTRKQWSGVLAGGEFASYSTYLSSDGGRPYVRFRLTTDGEGQNDDGVHLDNVRVLCKSSTLRRVALQVLPGDVDGHAARVGDGGAGALAAPHGDGGRSCARRCSRPVIPRPGSRQRP